jgi:CRISPR-associated endonuclease/helicase Cas3
MVNILPDSINDYYSHTDKRLVDHLLNVAVNSRRIIEELAVENKELFMDLSFLIGICHDFAKCTTFFQDYLFSDDPAYNKDNKGHGRLSAIFGYYVIKNYFRKSEDTKFYPILAYIVINRHHGNLIDAKGIFGETSILNQEHITLLQIKNLKNQKYTHRFQNLRKFYKAYNISVNDFIGKYKLVKQYIIHDLKLLSGDMNLINYEELIFLYSVLLDADKFDASNTSMHLRKHISPEIMSSYVSAYHDYSSNISSIRDDAYNEINAYTSKLDLKNKIYSLTLPTGMGKTIDIISFSLKLREKIEKEEGFTPRIIYTLPFLSIIDQNASVIEDILYNSDIRGVDYLQKHTSLSDSNYTPSENDFVKEQSPELLIDGWYSEIIITTFIQLFYSLISDKNKSLRKFHNITNSIIILDEVQTIPPKYWYLLKTIFIDLARYYNTWIIFMSATQPLIFNPKEINEIITDKDKYFQQLDRVNYYFHNNKIPLTTFAHNMVTKIKNNINKDVMFVLNTTESSKYLYDYLKQNLNNSFQLIYLSTNLIPLDRLDRINRINTKTSKQKIIVTTQLIEAGVDIDVDIIYRDQAPIDSIIQTAGRCNRNNKHEKGEVHLVKLTDNKGNTYSTIYSQTLIKATEELTRNINIISEKEFNMKIPELYHEKVKESISQEESHRLMEKIEKLELRNLQDDFKLIEDTDKLVDVFIEKDEKAKEIWNKYRIIRETNNREEFKKIKPEFYNYVIQIYKDKLGNNEYDEKRGIGYISHDNIKDSYDEETGYINEK